MKKNTFSQLKLLSLCLILVAIAGITSAQWQNPLGASPTLNVEVPVHAGADQVKNGSLAVGTFLTSGSANEFTQNAYMKGIVQGNDVMYPAGTTPATANVVNLGTPPDIVAMAVNGAAKAVQALQSNKVSSGDPVTKVPLCADPSGMVVWCPATVPDPDPDYCSNIDGIQSDIPTGATYNTDGTCTYPDANASIQSTSGCHAPGIGFEGAGFIGGSDAQLSRGGYYTAKIHLDTPPVHNQTLTLRLCSSHPYWHAVFLGERTDADVVTICEGSPTIAQRLNTPQDSDTFGGEYHPPGPLLYLVPAVLDRDARSGTVYTANYGTIGGMNDTNNPSPLFKPSPLLTIPLTPGVTEYPLPPLSCSRSGKGGKLKWSYLKRIEYKFTRQSDDHNYTFLGSGNLLLP